MPAIGYTLRATREARGESIQDVAGALKLTGRQVEALETDRFDLLPGKAFARGFLRNYARHLQLDAAPLLAALDQFTAGDAMDLAPVSNAVGTMPSAGERLRPSSLPVALIAFGLFLLVLSGWYFNWFQQPVPNDELLAEENIMAPEPTAVDAPTFPGHRSGAAGGAEAIVTEAPANAPAAPTTVSPPLVRRTDASRARAAGTSARRHQARCRCGRRRSTRFPLRARRLVRSTRCRQQGALFRHRARRYRAGSDRKGAIQAGGRQCAICEARAQRAQFDMVPHIKVTVARFKVE